MALNNESRIDASEFLWLDTSVNRQESQNGQARLRLFVDRLQVFEDLDRCEQHIQSTLTDDQLALIVGGQTGLQIIPRVHQLPQVSTIYIQCANFELPQTWTQEYTKVIVKRLSTDDRIL
jgi:hypothetical protein